MESHSCHRPAWLDSGELYEDGLPLPGDQECRKWRDEAVTQRPNKEAWRRLILRLRYAAEIKRGKKCLAGLSADKTEVALQIKAITEFLNEHAFLKNYDALAPMNRLYAALIDLSEGRINPLFRPEKLKNGSPGVGNADAYIIALAARAMSALMLEGALKKDASRAVATALHANKGKYSRTPATTVQGWRDRINEGEGRIPAQALDHYNNTIPQGLNSKQLLEALKGAARLGLVESD